MTNTKYPVYVATTVYKKGTKILFPDGSIRIVKEDTSSGVIEFYDPRKIDKYGNPIEKVENLSIDSVENYLKDVLEHLMSADITLANIDGLKTVKQNVKYLIDDVEQQMKEEKQNV